MTQEEREDFEARLREIEKWIEEKARDPCFLSPDNEGDISACCSNEAILPASRIDRHEVNVDGRQVTILTVDEFDNEGKVVSTQQYLQREDGTIEVSITAFDSMTKPLLARPASVPKAQNNECKRTPITNCRNCGAVLENLRCQYCGTNYQHNY